MCASNIGVVDILEVKQFRALSDQLYRDPKHHQYVRKCIVKQVSVSLTASTSTVKICLDFDGDLSKHEFLLQELWQHWWT